MPNRILFLVSAVLASLVLPVIPNAAFAADDCLASPDNKATPAGGHWRYHIEHGTGRKCWYLAGQTAKSEQASSDQTRSDQTKADDAAADAAKPASNDADTTASAPPRPVKKIRPSLERAAAAPPDRPRPAKPQVQPAEPAPANNARAEFIDTPRDGQPAPAPQTQADPQASVPEVAAPLLAPQSSVATRWPSPTGTVSSDNTPPPATALTPAPQPAAEPQPEPVTDQATPTPATQQTVAAPANAADGPDYLLYALIAAVTAFAAVVGFAALRFFADWWRDWRDEQRWRRSVPSFAAVRGASMLKMGDVPMGLASVNDAVAPRPRGQRIVPDEEPPRRLEDEIDEIEQLLALTREAGGETRTASYAPWVDEAPRDAAE